MAAQKRPGRPKEATTDDARIRTVFLDRRTTYTAPAAVQLSGMDRAELMARIATGEIDATERVTYRIPWDDVARMLMERVPLEAIYTALGDRAEEVLPPLLRPERLDVNLPAFVLRVLEWAAKAEGVPVERYLRREMFDFIESLWSVNPEMDDLPGVVEALFFPEAPPARRRTA